jgi:hypothetical protein
MSQKILNSMPASKTTTKQQQTKTNKQDKNTQLERLQISLCEATNIFQYDIPVLIK